MLEGHTLNYTGCTVEERKSQITSTSIEPEYPSHRTTTQLTSEPRGSDLLGTRGDLHSYNHFARLKGSIVVERGITSNPTQNSVGLVYIKVYACICRIYITGGSLYKSRLNMY